MFAGQICAGGHSLAALACRTARAKAGQLPATLIGYGRSEEVSVCTQRSRGC